jgi:acyl-[acyl-carrier-protein]-phospholipid O-acyltransferase/long-chain-fatty-acid--[acyl-carrier-protein] ligase
MNNSNSEVSGQRSDSRTLASPRGFWCLFVTQFQGAFSDNVFKFLVTFLIIGLLPPGQRDRLVPLVGALFALPFILFSMAGGYLADRYSKRNVAIAVKVAEIGVMLLATLALGLKFVPLMLAIVFLLSTQAAFFGPTKYGLLPELLPEKQLSWGNGLIGLGTFMSVIAGTVAAGALSRQFGDRQIWSGVLLLVLACMGTASSLGINRLPPADPEKQFRLNFLSDLWTQFQTIRRDRVLLIAVLASNYIWFLGALLQPTLIFYGKDVLKLDDLHSGYLQAALAVGIGLGSAASGYLSAKKIEIGFVPIGALGLAIFGALLARSGLSANAFAANLVALGFWGGFYVVPVNALVQYRPDPGSKGGVIAASAFLSWVGILAASGLYYFLRNILKLEQAGIFVVGAGLSLLGTIAIACVMPESILRLVLWVVSRTIYRVRVLGRDNIPERGGALFVCNHLSLVDAVLLQASTDRPIRFVMFKGHYEKPLIKPWAKVSGAIPISSELRPREMIQSLRTASEAIRVGEVVCIFAEGQITRIGQMLPFRRGFQKIMKDVDAPIVPVALDGVWGSIFSFEKHRFLWKLPRRIPFPVTVNYGKPLPPTATPFEVRQAVQELLAGAWHERREHMKPLHRAFVRTARLHPFRFAMADMQTAKLSFGWALVRTVFLARRLKKIWRGQKMVGLLLPPSVPGALVNWAAMLCGKVPVNLNYTVSEQTLTSCIQQCEIKTVITSRVFLEKVKLKVACEAVFLEDAACAPTAGEKLAAVLMAWLLPVGLLERAFGREKKVELDDLATVIFSSGSTGEPKGVMLSHYNIGSNIEQMEQVFCPQASDRFLGILPFFHSFGFTGTLCLPAVLGVGAVYYPNPLDAKTIGPFVSQYAVTFLLATPTFLQLYMRGCNPADFGSLRVVMTAAEKLPERLASAFEENFGIRPMEGYGCTECAPAVAVNTHDFRSAGFRQVGAKRGKIGHPLPGVCVRIVDVATGEPVTVEQPGLLLVRGPNVMQGYLGKPENTAEVVRDGWYVTGDVAALDEDGFLQITDRLSRFSKIGGEMVPHIKVEEKLHELAGATEQTFVVTGVPDEKKGERLVVLHKLADAALKECFDKLAQSDLPNLWKPRAESFFRMENFPLLGTGKLDLRKVKEAAAQFSTNQVVASA